MKPTWPAFKTATSTSIAFNTAFALTQVYNHSHPPKVVSVLTTPTPAHTTQPAETKITMPSLASNSYLSASSTTRNEPAPRTPHRPRNRISNASSTDSEAEYDALVARVRAWQRERLRTPQKGGAGSDADSEEEEEEEGCESDADESEDEDEDEEEGEVSVFVRSDGDCCSEGYEADDEGGMWDLVDGDEAFVGVGSDGEEFYYRAAVGEGGSGGSGGSDVEDEEEEEEESEDEDEDGSGSGGGESAAAGDRPRGTVRRSITLVEEEALDGDSAGERYRWRHTDRARLAAFRRQRMGRMTGFQKAY